MTAVQSDTSGDTSKLSVFQLFQYASLADTFLMLFGAIAGIINGTTLPVLTIIFGEVIQAIVTFDGSDQGKANVDQNVRDGVIKMVSIGLITLTTAYIQMSFWMLAGENQTQRIRVKYFRAILSQDVAWFDKESTGDLTNRLTTSMTIIQEGISDKIGLMIQFLSAFFAGFIIGYIKGWQLALVLTGSLPFLAGAAMTLAKILASGSEKEQAAYGQAGGVAQQVLSSIRTVVSFGGEEYDAQRYSKNLDVAEREGIKKSFVNGAGVGMIQFLIMSVYALAFGYGNSLVPVTMNVGQVLNVIFAIIIGAFSLGNATPHISSLAKALGTAASIFATIDRHSPINPLSNDGDQLSSVNGEIEFKDVSFAYPSRPDSQILAKFNLHVKAGQTIALVGTSGSGKSTIVKLLERFYDPEGIITLDGRNIKDLNVRWLRQQIGMVSQEPALFDTSIKNNIAYGLLDYDSIEISLLDKQIEDACRQANCWDFIQLLPCKLDTKVGEAGGQLSGGQRQRICIARAIIKNPKILLLDEATSALDTQSERVVQDALDAASVNRTTIVIAHRLSTVQKADIIVVMKLGEIVEIGSPSDLLDNGGMYSTLVKTQSLKVRESSTKDATDDLNHTKLERSTKIEGSDHSRDDDLNSTNHLPKPTVQYSRLLRYNRFDGICAAMNGAVQPLFSILFSVILTTLGTKQAYTYSYMFIGLAFVAFISNFGQIGLFQYTGEKMTRRVREDSFRALLSQEIGFFDIDANSTGALTSKLAEDARLVQGLTGQSLGAAVQAISGMTTGLTIAFTACWQLSFVIVGMIPIIGMAGFFQFKALVGFGEKTKAAYEKSSQKASEAIMNIRTIITITQERKFFEAYCESIESPHQLTRRGAVISSLGFAFSQSVLHFAWATSLYYGAQLLKMGLYPPDAVLRAMFCVIFTAMAAGQIQNYTPDIAKAKLAALSIFTILDRQSLIDVTKQLGESKFEVKGTIDAQRLEFSYPTRKNHKILNGLDIKAMSGKTVALVGHSGCGKSTVLGLILRWYDVSGGRILFESLNIRDWNLKSLRSFVGVVGQEPILFNTSIRENIAYGALLPPDDLNIYEAAKLANIHDFIMTLPLNYDTLVGEKGGQLSGGQKQRTAIARALIRNPKLLLLDEATSALDSESELVVQEALDKAAKGRTTLVIAHRLSTIQNADLILVVDQGQISESGTHFDLIDQNGLYYQLVSQQQLLAN